MRPSGLAATWHFRGASAMAIVRRARWEVGCSRVAADGRCRLWSEVIGRAAERFAPGTPARSPSAATRVGPGPAPGTEPGAPDSGSKLMAGWHWAGGKPGRSSLLLG